MQVKQQAIRAGELTGRAIGVVILILTSLAWFGFALNQTVGGLALALMLSALTVIMMITALVIHKWRQ